MTHRIARLAAMAIALSALDASAQDLDAFPPAPEGSAQPPGSAAPAPATAPTAPATTPKCAEPRLQPYELILYADAVAQSNRRAREVERLHAVMNREGQEFSEEKYDSYRNRKAAGVVLIVLGTSSMFAAMVSGITLASTTGSSDEYDDEYGDEHEEESRSSLLPGLPLGLLFSGIAAAAIGVPLTISGASGRKRQAILSRKDEILAPSTPPAAYVSFFADPVQGAGGLQLKVTF